MTKAEACLWKFVLRAGTMRGYTFRRQRPVLNYIADFMCKELKLVIEVDGITHYDDETRIKDELRQKDLETVGFVVLRFNDNEVLNNIDSVFQTIDVWIEEYEKAHGLNPPPNPRQRGTREK
jgi:very-short-patch-repair endonuclease